MTEASTAYARSTSAARKRKTMSIGVVLSTLQQSFPDVTVSKIRFLESEGLVLPERTASGYRRYTDEDVQRLVYILTTQRDHYTPLKVIKQQLDAMDSGQVTALLSAGQAETMVSAENFRAPVITRLTDTDIAQQAASTEQSVAHLVQLGLISPDAAGFFTADDVAIVSAFEALQNFGFDDRQLKSLRNSALRQADLISQVVGPVAHGQHAHAGAQAQELSQQISALVVSLHATLLKNQLRQEFS